MILVIGYSEKVDDYHLLQDNCSHCEMLRLLINLTLDEGTESATSGQEITIENKEHPAI